jgi:hypothetical protein
MTKKAENSVVSQFEKRCFSRIIEEKVLHIPFYGLKIFLLKLLYINNKHRALIMVWGEKKRRETDLIEKTWINPYPDKIRAFRGEFNGSGEIVEGLRGRFWFFEDINNTMIEK